MKALISALSTKATCTWCEKELEAVTVEFDGGFLTKGWLCWKCLQQATRVHDKQQTTAESRAKPNKSE
jgi:hypothetical protein